MIMDEASLYTESLIYIIMLAAIVLSALCSMLEATLLSTPLSYITGLEDQGVKGAKRLKKLKQHPDRPISAILCLNTIANTVGASIVGSLVYSVYGDAIVGVFSTIFTFAILIFSEIIPKTIGTSYWRSLALPASAIINGMIFIMFPLVWLLEKLTRLISSGSTQVSVSREDIAAMVSVATEEEVIEKEEKKMIQNLLKLDEITAHEIMTPSAVVEMAESHMTIRNFYDSEELTHSRIPVYDDENDEYVIGYVLRQEILEKMAEDKFTTTLNEITHPIMTFANPIGIGISSTSELALIGVDEEISPKDLVITLNNHLPNGFKVLAAKKEFAKSPFTALHYAQYKINVKGNIANPAVLLDMPEIIMPKKTKSGVKDTDIKPFIRSIFTEGQIIYATVRCGETNLKPELLVEALEKYTNAQIEEYTTERTALLDENLKDLIEF